MFKTPTATQVEQLLASDSEEPVVMLNLLRFKEEADGIDDGVSGRDAYTRYADAAAPFLEVWAAVSCSRSRQVRW